MPKCILFENEDGRYKGKFFNIPKEERRIRIRSNICSMDISSKDCTCGKHFLASDMRKNNRFYLIPVT